MVTKCKIESYLDFFSRLSIYFTVPRFLLENDELMKHISELASEKVFKNSDISKEKIVYFICYGIIKEASEQ